MSEENQNDFTGTFFSKLKEQSFTILMMLGVIYYQHRLMEERVAYWQKLYEEKESYIEMTTKEDRQIMLDRVKYLQDQRDKYVEDAINELKTK
jgi:uroporphyrinogen-III decarboxylase